MQIFELLLQVGHVPLHALVLDAHVLLAALLLLALTDELRAQAILMFLRGTPVAVLSVHCSALLCRCGRVRSNPREGVHNSLWEVHPHRNANLCFVNVCRRSRLPVPRTIWIRRSSSM